MKELIHKARQVFMSTRIVENKFKYQMLCWGCVGIHLAFTILMFIGQVYLLSALNLAATIFYTFLVLILVPREKYKLLFLMALVEIELNASIASILLGDGYEFMLYTLSLIPGAFYVEHTWPENTEGKKKQSINLIPIISTFCICVMYVLVDIHYIFMKPVYSGDMITKMRPYFHYFNIMIALFVLLAFSVLFALEVRYIQKMLNDENARLGKIASVDPLTKALNRRSFTDSINLEIENNDDLSFGLILLDIDDFKKINDTYGHIVGDEVLTRVAKIMKSNLREGDLLGRWGGEEFLLLIHGSSEDSATVAERVRESISAEIFESEKYRFSVTATLGLAAYQAGLQVRTLVDMADQKMYYGKTHGKNQVVK